MKTVSLCGLTQTGVELTQTLGAVRTLALPALLLALAERGEFGGYLLLDAALLVQLVGGADEVDGNLSLGRQGVAGALSARVDFRTLRVVGGGHRETGPQERLLRKRLVPCSAEQQFPVEAGGNGKLKHKSETQTLAQRNTRTTNLYKFVRNVTIFARFG